MSVLSKLPVSIGGIIKETKVFGEQRLNPIHVEIIVDATAPAGLIEEVRASFVPSTPAGKLKVDLMTEVFDSVSPSGSLADLTVILVGSNSDANNVIHRTIAQKKEGSLVVALTTAEVEFDTLMSAFDRVPPSHVIVGADGAEALALLVDRLAQSSNSKRIALATNFSIFRERVAKDLVYATSLQNAIIGVIPIIPGADMPIMTMAQVRMVLQMATAYDRPTDAGRIVEASCVVLAAFGWRGLSHVLSGALPLPSWLLRGALGYLGTFAVGMAMAAYFENDLDFYDSIYKKIISLRQRQIAGKQSPAQIAAGSVS